MQGAKKNKQKDRKKCHHDEDTKEEEVKRGSGNTKGLIQALRQLFQAYMHLLIHSRYKKKHADAKIAMRKKKSLKAGKRHRHT